MPSFDLPGVPSLLSPPSLPAIPAIPGLPSLPALPSLNPLSIPALPALPGLPALSSVPVIPGMPSLPGPPSLGAVAKLQDVTIEGKKNSVSWGIYRAGTTTLVVKPDSIIAFDYKREWRLADYPLEDGAFESYNKVAVPFDVKVRMTKGSAKPAPGASADPSGSLVARRDFLNTLEDAAASLDLYDVITPEIGYYGVNIVSVDYRREASNGVGLITVEVALRQVRLTAVATNTATKAPSGAAAVSSGSVQPKPPSSSQASAAKGAIDSAKAAVNKAKGIATGAASQITSAASATAASLIPSTLGNLFGSP